MHEHLVPTSGRYSLDCSATAVLTIMPSYNANGTFFTDCSFRSSNRTLFSLSRLLSCPFQYRTFQLLCKNVITRSRSCFHLFCLTRLSFGSFLSTARRRLVRTFSKSPDHACLNKTKDGFATPDPRLAAGALPFKPTTHN